MHEDRTAADVFALLSDETRVDVLAALAAAQRERSGGGAHPGGLSFSALYDRVDVDNTSKLSYHLGELTGTFLRKTDEGYAFTHAGEQVVRFVLARNYEEPRDFGRMETGGTCPFCGGQSLEAALNHQLFYVECTDCGRPVFGYSVTPAQSRTWEGRELLDAVKRRQVADFRKVRRGVCAECGARLDTAVRPDPSGVLPDADSYLVVDDCGACLRQYSAPMTFRVAYHVASVAFHWDVGVDLLAKGPWELHEYIHDGRWTSERVGADPEAYEVVLRHGDDALRARLDGTGTVTRTERVRRRDHETRDS